ncbi:MAG: pseudouridine-5'-phosphate glycosidase, partial [Gemmataceae bacterium]
GMNDLLDLRPQVADALRQGRPVVALESTLVAHGLPWPRNLETGRAAEAAVREAGAVPATIAVLAGRPTVGLDDAELERLARSGGFRKASSRDLGVAVAQRLDAATTVSATMRVAFLAGVRVFATGGIGGVHPAGGGPAFDVSADLTELARTPVAVVCAGAKSILDLPATLEFLETQGVPVLGYQSDTFAAFYLRSSGLPVSARVDTPAGAAGCVQAHWGMGGGGVVIAQPLAETDALPEGYFHGLLHEAEGQARRAGVGGAALTPYLLCRLAELSGGRTLAANQALIVANARLAGRLAGELASGAPCRAR